MDYLSLEISGSIAYLTINRPEKRNAFNQQMWRNLPKLLAKAVQANTRCLILQASGDKAFCAGADIDELTVMIKDKTELKVNNQYIQEAQQALAVLPIVTIALINGACMGGGLGLAMACDFRIAANHAKFAITPAKLGLLYSIADTKRVYELVGLSRAKELLMLSKVLDAATAVDYGLINQQCELDQLTDRGEELCQQVLLNSGYSQRGIKLTLNQISGEQQVTVQQLDDLFIDAFDGDDFNEGAAAFLEKRKPKFC
ncbi:enoyl-CoA hydratase/isomerase family protein [Thalassotalea psychrophila]|uniref:Enoyl-CoA hydratase/isomerase family protein n=1 Tax=Thalassotalea psychrophila TaxID=3065647 RepID=A0ABY9TTL1_9GAMM|nr:enoyl-CoA hydratase/isomerase family protein [Colwelliaceae bacterium SQ149]